MGFSERIAIVNASKYVQIFKDKNVDEMKREDLVVEFMARHDYSYVQANRYLKAIETYDDEDTSDALFIRSGRTWSWIRWTGKEPNEHSS